MRGVSARQPHTIALDGDGSVLEFDEAAPPDAADLAGVLATEPAEIPTGVTVGSGEPYDDLQLYLAASLPRTAHLAFGREVAGRGLASPQPGFPALVAGAGSIAYLAVREVRGGFDARFEFVACGLGPIGAMAAAELAGLVEFWAVNLRGAGDPVITVSPHGPLPDAVESEHQVVKTHSTVHLAFPTTLAAMGDDDE